jgi:hypothetical protein
MLLGHLLVSHVFAYTCIDFIEDPQLYGFLIVYLYVFCGVDCTLQSACEDGQILSLLLVLDQLVQDVGQGLGVFHALRG